VRFGGVSVNLDQWERKESLAPLLQEGRNGLSWAALRDGIEVFIGREIEGVIPFARQGRVALAVGEPLCATGFRPALLGEFTRWCRTRSLIAAAFPIGPALGEALRINGFQTAVAGLEPCLDLTREGLLDMGRGVRHAVSRVQQDGLTVHQIVSSEVGFTALLDEVLVIREAWLRTKSHRVDRYLFEMHPEDGLDAKRFFLARINGRPAGYLSCVPSHNGARWTAATLARTPDAPTGTSEALICGAVRALSEMGVDEFSLGAVVLAGVDPDSGGDLAGLRRRMRWLYSHPPGPVHNANLLSFKKKFHPDWVEPAIVAIQVDGLDAAAEADLLTLLAGEHAGVAEPVPSKEE
jgi:phosphatidylglycerol lysyltransferase